MTWHSNLCHSSGNNLKNVLFFIELFIFVRRKYKTFKSVKRLVIKINFNLVLTEIFRKFFDWTDECIILNTILLVKYVSQYSMNTVLVT